MGRARRWAGEVTCDTVMTGELSAVACAAKESTNCQRCIPLVGLRQRRRLAVHDTSCLSAFEFFDGSWARTLCGTARVYDGGRRAAAWPSAAVRCSASGSDTFRQKVSDLHHTYTCHVSLPGGKTVTASLLHGLCQPLPLGMRDRPGHQCHAPDGERSIRPTSEGPWPGWRPIRRRPGRVQWVRASKASWVAMRRATRAHSKCTRLRPLALSGRTYVARMVGWVCQVVVVERAAHSDTSCARWRPWHLTRQATESIIVIRRPVPLTHTLRFDAFTS